MTLECKDRKKSLIELTKEQDITVVNLAKEKKLYKVDIIRKLIDILEGLSGDIHVVAYDKKNLVVLNNFKDIINLDKSDNIAGFTLNCKYDRRAGVNCDLNFYTSISFGGKINDSED